MTASALLSRLKALGETARLSRRTADRIGRLIERLEAPVRVGLFGLPGTGKAALANALAGAEVLRPDAPSVPVLMRWAGESGARLTQAGGRTSAMALDTPFVAPPGTLFAELGLDLPALARMSVLTVAADAAPGDMAAAMAWAAPRCDIALWCTRDWTDAERKVWKAGPDRLKNHALLVATSGPDPIGRARADACFEDYRTCVVPGPGLAFDLASDQVRALQRRLTDMIDTARSADLDAAAFLLEQHAPLVAAEATTTEPAFAPGPPETPEAPSGRPARPGPDLSQFARTVLSRMVWQVRHTAWDLADELPNGALTEAEAALVLARLQAVFDRIVDLADADDAFADQFPALHAELLNAHELVQLLKIEGQPMQATEGLILLGQMRREVCHALAA